MTWSPPSTQRLLWDLRLITGSRLCGLWNFPVVSLPTLFTPRVVLGVFHPHRCCRARGTEMQYLFFFWLYCLDTYFQFRIFFYLVGEEELRSRCPHSAIQISASERHFVPHLDACDVPPVFWGGFHYFLFQLHPPHLYCSLTCIYCLNAWC